TDVHRRNLARTAMMIKAMTKDVLPSGEMLALDAWGRISQWLGHAGRCYVLNISTSADRQIDRIIQCDPTYLVTTPSNLDQIIGQLAALQEHGRIEIDQFLTLGEMVSGALRAKVRRCTGKAIIDCYSCTEIGIIAF